MLVGTFISSHQALETNSVMGGLTYLQIVQQVIDDVWADDSFIRIYQPPPYLTTVDTELEYAFKDLLTAAPFLQVDGETAIRKIRGIYDPSLSPTDAEVQDYQRGYVPDFDQRNIHARVYNGNLRVDNERKKIYFDTNPGATTAYWKADLYLKAPVVSESSEIPLLAGWERKLLLPGCRAWFEELDSGKPGTQAVLFDARKVKYRDALERESRLNNKTDEKGFEVDSTFVRPQ